MKILKYLTSLILTVTLWGGVNDHLVFSEVVLQPTAGSYVAIYNPTAADRDLSDYYLTDASDPANDRYYFQLPSGTDYWSGSAFDFIVRFPDGYSIAAGQTIYIAIYDSATYKGEYGIAPDLALKQDFRPALDGASTKPVATFNVLDKIVETLVLFHWDGSSATVQDVDYLLWGDNSLAIDKSGETGYAADTPVTSQSYTSVHADGEKLVRTSGEGNETASGGNGITGHDETSEDFSATWQVLPLASSRPKIVSFSMTPAEPIVGDQLTFNAIVTDDGILSTVELIQVLGGITEITAMNSTGGDNYSLTLPTAETAGSLQWKIRAIDDTNLKDSTAWQVVIIGSGAPEILSATVNPTNPEKDNTLIFSAIVTDNSAVASVELLHQFAGGTIQSVELDYIGDDNYSISLDPFNAEGILKWKIRATDDSGLMDSTSWKTLNITDPSAHLIPFQDILAGGYEGKTVVVQGLLVDYFDITVYNGPHSLTLEDNEGYQVECTVWPSDWDIPNSPQAFLLQPPFGKYVIRATGVASYYAKNAVWQIGVTSFDDFDIVKIYGCPDPDAQTNEYGDCIYPGDYTKASINPAPFVLIPTMGEHLDYEYSFPANSRVIIRVFDISGRFVTSLVDEFYAEAGEVQRTESWAGWDGRDHLGQIVAPGTYFMHIEATDFQSGKTSTDIAPVVIGVKF
ncbi:MAG: hypothetical protein ABIA75_11930 [Candidatus Neomarinimicrobiota bacterium]